MDKKILFSLSYGLYIVSSINDGKLNGQVANTVFQVTSDPVTVAISINRQNLTHEYISKSNLFSVTVLSEDTPLQFIGKFGFKSGRDIDKFADTKYESGVKGLPIIKENSVGFLHFEVQNRFDVEDTHTLFIGRLIDGDILSDSKPMTYAYYHDKKRGKTPERAPTFVKL